MANYIEVGSAPFDEECVYVTDKKPYIREMLHECIRYKSYLEKLFSEQMPDGCEFGIKMFPHDFGSYYEVVIYFDDEIEEQCDFAYMVEDNLPEKWEE